jgi:hypothetical protein
MAYLRERGYLVLRVEHWNAFTRRRQDLLSCDLLALKAGEPPLLVQVTTRDHQAARRTKILSTPGVDTWLRTGGRICVHGWALVGPRGSRKTWAVSETEVSLADLGSASA